MEWFISIKFFIFLIPVLLQNPYGKIIIPPPPVIPVPPTPVNALPPVVKTLKEIGVEVKLLLPSPSIHLV